jgi:chromosomal replication initiator protein
MGEINNISPYTLPGMVVDHLDILRKVAKLYDMEMDDILKKTNSRDIVEPRQLACYLIYKYNRAEYKLQRLASIFNYKNHSCVIHSIRQIENLLNTDKKFENKVKSLI